MSRQCSFHKTKRECDFTCFPCTFMHGLEEGNGGLWASTGVPKKYKGSRLENLPYAEENPKALQVVTQYINRIMEMVQEKNVGLFLYSIPDESNPFGTGTGKTTTGTAILNHYVIERARAYFRGQQQMKDNPAIFVKSTELQNNFNGQFRGTFAQKEKASIRYYNLKEALKKTELVVLDDLATRGSKISDAFEDELYEIIDYRDSQMDSGATIFTSNVPMDSVASIVGERIASRIAGMTVKVGFRGSDNRLDSLFK